MRAFSGLGALGLTRPLRRRILGMVPFGRLGSGVSSVVRSVVLGRDHEKRSRLIRAHADVSSNVAVLTYSGVLVFLWRLRVFDFRHPPIDAAPRLPLFHSIRVFPAAQANKYCSILEVLFWFRTAIFARPPARPSRHLGKAAGKGCFWC